MFDDDQETPNVQTASAEYADGSIMDIEVTNLYTHPIGGILGTGNFFYTSEGYLSSANGYEAVRGQFIPRTPDVDADGIARGHELGLIGDDIWISQGIPLVIFFAVGFLLSLILGDLLLALLLSVLA